jgi:hypothetical protein
MIYLCEGTEQREVGLVYGNGIGASDSVTGGSVVDGNDIAGNAGSTVNGVASGNEGAAGNGVQKRTDASKLPVMSICVPDSKSIVETVPV